MSEIPDRNDAAQRAGPGRAKSAVALPLRLFSACRRALSQFLALPLIVVIGFIVLNVIIYTADDAWSKGKIPPGFSWLGELLGDSKSLSALLSTVASSIITVTSITFSLLLIALQQGAAALTTQVTDQFLMRKSNQFFFGFFVGLSVFVLMTLVTASEIHRPIFGTAVALILTTAALCMIVVMIYSTIDQMRPSQIVRAIHQHVLSARARELGLLNGTRRSGHSEWPVALAISSCDTGHLTKLHVATLDQAVKNQCGDGAHVELVIRIGTFVALHDPLAVVRVRPSLTLTSEQRNELKNAVLDAIVIDNDRDLAGDPRYGLSQLSTIAWTSISTAKSNPSPGNAVVDATRDIISRWGSDLNEVKNDQSSTVIYADETPFEAINVLETIVLVASESIQAQTVADTLHTIAVLLVRVPQPLAERLVDVTRRALSSLGEHVLTRDLEIALGELAIALDQRGFNDMSDAVSEATAQFGLSLGKLNSRSTRVSQG